MDPSDRSYRCCASHGYGRVLDSAKKSFDWLQRVFPMHCLIPLLWSAAREPAARWFFTLTPSGVTALETAREMQARMWAGLSLKGLKNRS